MKIQYKIIAVLLVQAGLFSVNSEKICDTLVFRFGDEVVNYCYSEYKEKNGCVKTFFDSAVVVHSRECFAGKIMHVYGSSYSRVPLGVICSFDNDSELFQKFISADTNVFNVCNGLGLLKIIGEEFERYVYQYGMRSLFAVCKKNYDYSIVEKLKVRSKPMNIDSILNEKYGNHGISDK